jgi:TatD DNase family protein
MMVVRPDRQRARCRRGPDDHHRSREHSPKALSLAQAHPGALFATAGVHPHHAVEYTEECDAEMRALHAHPKWSRSANAGWTTSAISRRGRRSARHSSASCRSRDGDAKPLFLHQRDAHADFMAMMKALRGQAQPGGGALLHRQPRGTVRLPGPDWHIGITGWLCDERRGRTCARWCAHPGERLMIETDAPYLLPRTQRAGLTPGARSPRTHRRNEPAFFRLPA